MQQSARNSPCNVAAPVSAERDIGQRDPLSVAGEINEQCMGCHRAHAIILRRCSPCVRLLCGLQQGPLLADYDHCDRCHVAQVIQTDNCELRMQPYRQPTAVPRVVHWKTSGSCLEAAWKLYQRCACNRPASATRCMVGQCKRPR